MTVDPREEGRLVDATKEAGQEHIFRWWDELGESDRDGLLAQVKSIDFKLLSRLVTSLLHDEEPSHCEGTLETAEVIRVPRTDEERQAEKRARERGEELLAEGKVCAVLVAGGQATRMGCDGPKGVVPIGPISGKSFFELYAEIIRAIERRYGAVLPWYMMTSVTNDEQTKRFFEDHDYFGILPANVRFVMQDMLPAVDFSGKIIMDSKSHIFMSPTGHGASLRMLHDRGAIADMKSRGLELIYHFQVDNPLIALADPVFLGYHDLNGAEMSSKMVDKNSPTEGVGIACIKDGKNVVIEYSDLDKKMANERTPDGRFRFWPGNIAQHVINVSFVERMRPIADTMPFHVARKKVPYVNERGERCVPDEVNGVKFESFVFDALPYAKKIVHMEIVRENEYCPVKTLNGHDSPDVAKQFMSNVCGRWLESAGVKVPRNASGTVTARIEINPLYALDEEELARKVDRNLVVGDELYLSEN